MNYYALSTSTDLKVVGSYTQTDGMGPTYDLSKPTSVWNIPDLQVPDFEPDFDFFTLSSKAKLTDVISTGLITASGFIVNEKVKALFERMKLPSHRFYPAKVMYKGHKTDYFWFQIEDNILLKDAIDFTKSEFDLRHPLPFMKDSSRLNLTSTVDLIKVWKEETDIKKIVPVQLCLRKEFMNYAMLAFSCFWNGVVINEQFKHEIETNRITGFQFKPAFPISF